MHRQMYQKHCKACRLSRPRLTLLKLHFFLFIIKWSEPWSSLQQIVCLCLFDLSAAFDTLDHSILIHRLTSWLYSVLGQILPNKIIDHSMSTWLALNPPAFSFYTESLKELSSDLFFSSYIPLPDCLYRPSPIIPYRPYTVLQCDYCDSQMVKMTI